MNLYLEKVVCMNKIESVIIYLYSINLKIMWTMKYTIKVFQEEDGSFYAEVAELPGCFSSWKDIDELKVNVKEAISCYLEWINMW